MREAADWYTVLGAAVLAVSFLLLWACSSQCFLERWNIEVAALLIGGARIIGIQFKRPIVIGNVLRAIFLRQSATHQGAIKRGCADPSRFSVTTLNSLFSKLMRQIIVLWTIPMLENEGR